MYEHKTNLNFELWDKSVQNQLHSRNILLSFDLHKNARVQPIFRSLLTQKKKNSDNKTE